MSSVSPSKRARRPRPIQDESGFTLLEVMISMAILVFISFGIYQATTETYKLRDILQNEGDFYNSIRLSMNILERDIELIYSPIQMMPNPNPSTTPGAAPAQPPPDLGTVLGDAALTTKYWEGATDKTAIRPSRFTGTGNSLSFIAASHIRVYKDAPESDLAKISYTLDHDDLDSASSVLVKGESPDAFQDEERRDTSARNYPLLHGVRSLKLRYYSKDRDTWLNSWDSDSEDTKNLYPDIVEVTIEVAGPSKLSFTGKYSFRPEIPLNGLDPSS